MESARGNDGTRISFVAWLPYHRRTELLAQHLGASLHFVYWGRTEDLKRAPVKYFIQGARTRRILLAERPEVILVQNPPIFCALVAYLYARRHDAKIIIDSHTGAFVSLKWRWSLPLHRALSRRALTTLVHNEDQEALVKGWGCPYMLLDYTPGDYSSFEPFPLNGGFSVAVISSFRGDERPEVVFRAAAELPTVQFYVTGNPERLAKGVLAEKPGNCHLTGYLPYERYVGLLRNADAVMALTARDSTLLMGGFEAVCIGKPFITSDWPVLRDFFSPGAVHVPYTEEGIREGVRRARQEHATLQEGALQLRAALNETWERKLTQLKELCQQP
jgi:glycosyltransferase involved in cell wall biosynthesis